MDALVGMFDLCFLVFEGLEVIVKSPRKPLKKMSNGRVRSRYGGCSPGNNYLWLCSL